MSMSWPMMPGRQVLAQGVEGGQRVLGGVGGDVRRAALAPGVLAAALHPHQEVSVTDWSAYDVFHTKASGTRTQ